jgi:hypothetical protein
MEYSMKDITPVNGALNAMEYATLEITRNTD